MNHKNFEELIQTYQGISSMVKEYAQEDIKLWVADVLCMSVESLNHLPMGGYSKGKASGAYQFVLQDVQKNIFHYDWLYDRLADDSSRAVYTRLMQYRILPYMELIKLAYDDKHHQYFDKTIVACDENEVFVDCGGYTGDTTEDYIRQYKNYKKIYLYEPLEENYLTCHKNLDKYKNIVIRKCGVGEKSSLSQMSGSGSSGSFVGASQDEAAESIEIISLDEDINEDVTFIKMDIEGYEIPSIIGAKNHIIKNNPKLAICLYHILSDIWEIPRLIDSINPGYDFHIRHYQPDQNWETVLYAIPKKKKAAQISQRQAKRVVAMSPFESWMNVQLIKDCGLIPYLLYKDHNCIVKMVGAKGDEYTNLEQYVKGMQMDFLRTGNLDEKYQYIKSNAALIDCLVLYGCYSTYYDIVNLYKELNPAGKIYLGLDANSHWMDRIDWTEPDFMAFMDSCDVIGSSCRAMQKHLNEKWPWNIEYFPNGYYSFQSERVIPEFNKKNNTILTVGRLGSSQKATNILLDAFANIADAIPDWTLRLVGTMEPDFEGFIKTYFKNHSQLKERVLFTGPIYNRDNLMNEYHKAKIFALSSTFEGAPNVISESLNAGCVSVVTKYDAYEDAINGGKCGAASDINDVNGFAKNLLDLCKNENLADMSQNAYEYGNEVFDMSKVVSRLYFRLFGGEK